MPESLLNILKYLLIALVWLFFLRVLRAVWVETRTPVKLDEPRSPDKREPAGGEQEVAGAPRRERRARLQLKVVSPRERKGAVYDPGEEITLGRAPSCGVALEGDSYASKMHARLFRQDGELWIEDLGSTNGTFLDSDRVTAPTRLRRGDRIQVGATVLEVTR